MAYSTREGPPRDESWFPPTPPSTPQETIYALQPREQEKRVGISVRDRIENWFIRPLRKFASEDVFICLTACLPLVEKRVRYELKQQGADDEMPFAENSPAIRVTADILGVTDTATTYLVWRAFRNGLLHRAMISPSVEYILRPDVGTHAPFERSGSVLTVYPLILRDRVVQMLESAPRKMWTQDECPFPEIYRLD